MELDHFSFAVLTISGGFAMAAYLLAYFHDQSRKRRSAIRAERQNATAAISVGEDASLQQAISELRRKLGLKSDEEMVRVALSLLRAACEKHSRRIYSVLSWAAKTSWPA